MPSKQRIAPVADSAASQWDDLGKHLSTARKACQLTQSALAQRAGLRQRDISLMEQGRWQPSLRILTNLARNLDVSLQYFIDGNNDADDSPHALTLELRSLGIVDLQMTNAIVPGGFREREKVLALSLSGDHPDPRIIEALPYVLLLHRWNVELFRAYVRKLDKRAMHRAAWLAEIALIIKDQLPLTRTVHQERTLVAFLRLATKPSKPDDLGTPPLATSRLPPYYQRWNIRYTATVADFLRRGRSLHELSIQ